VINQLVMDVAESVGRKTAADWPFMDAEDISQEILLTACTRADEYNALNAGELRVSLTKEAVAYCARERNDYVYRTARYLYAADEVRVLLAIAVESVGVEFDAPTKDGYVSAPDRGNVCVSLWDLAGALDAIPDAYRYVLLRRAEGEAYKTPDQRAEAIQRGWKPVGRSEHMTYSRALERVTQVLNRIVNRAPGEHDGPGSRKATSNARALAVTHDGRDGG
jgi:DNA-directed RNA polymerase specialized sigma24 family protein